jgi:hypothetical protein
VTKNNQSRDGEKSNQNHERVIAGVLLITLRAHDDEISDIIIADSIEGELAGGAVESAEPKPNDGALSAGGGT